MKTTLPTHSDAVSISVMTNDLDANIYVEAGAGTGKTYSLVQRIVALVNDGVDIDEIIAITFTRTAASELRSRIRGELEQLRAENPSDERIKIALNGIDSASFQTIDSLVYSILREHPFEAGLPPVVEVQDNFARDQMFRDRWRQWSVERLENDASFSQALSSAMRLEFDNPFNALSKLAEAMNNKHAAMNSVDFIAPQRIGLQTLADLASTIDHLRRLIDSCRNHDDRLRLLLIEAVDWYSESFEDHDVETEDEANRLLSTWPVRSPGNAGTAGNWGGPDGKVEALNALKSIPIMIEKVFDAEREVVTYELYRHAADFVATVVDERRRSGIVSYYDAITWLIELLARNDEIRRRLQRRYRRVLVDEFQDTDPNQVRLVRLLTIPPGEDQITPGSLFVVGDPKQSIFKFRGAKVEVSQRIRDDIVNAATRGKYLTLRENRRSTLAIVEWVNHVFGEWMHAEEGQADYIRLDLANDTAAPDDFGAVFHFGEPMADENIPEIRESDAASVAQIAKAVASGSLTVRDRQTGDPRPSEPGDLTILTRARTSWEIYTRYLADLNLPYSAEIGGSAVLETQEFRDILNCLAAIDDPSDQPSTVGALKSVHFGCNDVDLYDWAKSGGRFSCTAASPAGQDRSPVGNAMRTLRSYHELRDAVHPAVLAERLIRERQSRELMYLTADATPGLRRLDLAVELIRRFTENGASSLRDCLASFDQLKESTESLREEPSLEFDQGKIRIMTMHASKGLEFPIVLLADLGGTSGGGSGPFLSDDVSDGSPRVGVRLGGKKGAYFQTGDYQKLLDSEESSDELEKTRLLYVAATRARDHLIISRYRKENDDDVVAARFDKYVRSRESLWSPIPQHWTEATPDPGTDSVCEIQTQPVRVRAAWTRQHRETLTCASKRRWISPSSLKTSGSNTTDDTTIEKPDFNINFDPEARISRGRAATSIGSAVHASIQRALETPDTDIELITRGEAEKHGVSDRADEVEHLTKTTLEMPLLREAAAMKSEDIWVETPVAVSLPTSNDSTSVVEGVVDLIYRLPDGSLGIADFKTDQSRDRAIEEMAKPYEPQLGAYAYAVQKATGIEVTEASILFSRLATDKPGDGEYRLPNVQSAIELALKLASNR